MKQGEDEESRHNPAGLDDSELGELLDSIHACEDSASLRKAYSAAYKQAGAVKDKEAQKLIVKAKDTRKAQIAAGAYAVALTLSSTKVAP